MTGRSTLRTLSWIEGLSLLLLLLVAMPLKYAFGLPLAVRIVGSLHGVLFVALFAAALGAWIERALPSRQVLRVLALSLLPFGFLFADRVLRERG